MFRLLITGSRSWNDVAVIESELRNVYRMYGSDVVLVSGACPTGADAQCERVAKIAGWLIETHPADWNKDGKRAGFVRNAKMVWLGADMCLAFIKDESAGAAHTAELATKSGIQVRKVVM